MKTLIILAFILSACGSTQQLSEGTEITDPVMREKAIRYIKKKDDCLKTSMNDEQYLKCVGMKRLNYEDLYCVGSNCWDNDQTGLRE